MLRKYDHSITSISNSEHPRGAVAATDTYNIMVEKQRVTVKPVCAPYSVAYTQQMLTYRCMDMDAANSQCYHCSLVPRNHDMHSPNEVEMWQRLPLLLIYTRHLGPCHASQLS